MTKIKPHALLTAATKRPELVEMVQTLQDQGYGTVWGSGGTVSYLQQRGVGPIVKDVAELVGGQAILGHKVVTLSRETAAGLLVKVDDAEEMGQMAGLPVIDFLFVDPYDMKKAIEDQLDEEGVRGYTDVGALTLLHAAAKGRRIVLGDYKLWPFVNDWMISDYPDNDIFRRELARIAEHQVAHYAQMSGDFLEEIQTRQRPSDRTSAALLDQRFFSLAN